MDEIALYDRVLSAVEVRDHACAIVGLCGIPGDFNDDGTVDAGDYVLWRKNPSSFPADAYATWRSHFGQTGGSGSWSGTAIPEPVSLTLLLPAAAGLLITPRRRRA
jgi:hypothetical protein